MVVARAFQHEGPGRDERFAVGSWAAQIARAEEAGRGTVLVGDLSPSRDITDVRDVVRAYEALLDPSVPAGTYNVASGHAVAMREVLDMLVSLARLPDRGRGGSVALPGERGHRALRRCVESAGGDGLGAYHSARANPGRRAGRGAGGRC